MAWAEERLEFHIRPAAAGDAAAIAQLHAETFPRAWSMSDMRALITGAGAIAFVAETGTGPAGFLLARALSEEAEILTVGVHPEFRRQGLAARMLEELIRIVADDGASLFLEVAENNTGARRLYEKFGFERVGIRRDYYRTTNGRRVSALVLKRTAKTNVAWTTGEALP